MGQIIYRHVYSLRSLYLLTPAVCLFAASRLWAPPATNTGTGLTISVISGSAGVNVSDEGTFVANVSSLNCVGAGIACSDEGAGRVRIQVDATGSAGGGGASSLAVGTGSATSGNIVTTPTAIINLDAMVFRVQTTGQATAYVTLRYADLENQTTSFLRKVDYNISNSTAQASFYAYSATATVAILSRLLQSDFNVMNTTVTAGIDALRITDSTTSARVDGLQVSVATITAWLSGGYLSVYDGATFRGNATTLNFGDDISVTCSGSTCTVTGSASPGGGGGASSLSVGRGTPTNYVEVSSPTAILSFALGPFNVSLVGAATGYVDVNYSSLTAKGSNVPTYDEWNVGKSTINTEIDRARIVEATTSAKADHIHSVFIASTTLLFNATAFMVANTLVSTQAAAAFDSIRHSTGDAEFARLRVVDTTGAAKNDHQDTWVGSTNALINSATAQLLINMSTGFFAVAMTSPSVLDDAVWFMSPFQLQITSVSITCSSGTSVTGALYEFGASGVLNTGARIHADVTTTCGTPQFTTTITNAIIDPRNRVGWHTTAVSGAVREFNVTVLYQKQTFTP